jgi:hypothetical protein
MLPDSTRTLNQPSTHNRKRRWGRRRYKCLSKIKKKNQEVERRTYKFL